MGTELTIYGAAIATVLSVWGIVWKMTQDVKKEGHDGRSTLYRRFDEYKEHLERTHVSKEVHNIQYTQIEKKMDEIAADVKTLVRKANGG